MSVLNLRNDRSIRAILKSGLLPTLILPPNELHSLKLEREGRLQGKAKGCGVGWVRWPLGELMHQVLLAFVQPDLAKGQGAHQHIDACCNEAVVAHLIIQFING